MQSTSQLNVRQYSLFQDWQANKGNVKGRLILVAFRAANIFVYLPRPFRYVGYPYLILYRIVVEWILCVELPWKLALGSGFRLHHGQALVVSDRAVIGKNCLLRHSTTIGVAATSSDFGGGAPVIGNNVDVGANVVILGRVTIGNYAVIGAGSVVVKDVPPNATVVGNPARVIRYSDVVSTGA